MLREVMLPDERPVTEFTVNLLGPRVDHHVGRHVGLLGEGLSTHRTPVVLLTCVDTEMHAQVTRVAEGLAAVFTLVWLHPHMTHEMDVELSGGGEGSGTHAALKSSLSRVAMTTSGGIGAGGVGVSKAAVMGVAGPGGGGGAGCPIG